MVGWLLGYLLVAGFLERGTSGTAWCGMDACVDDVNPKIGSTNGGLRITLSGEGFAKSQMDLTNSPDIGNKVLMVSETRTYDCDIHLDGCTETQITCYTRPMTEDTYYVKVTVDGTEIPVHMHCRHDEGKSYWCSFRTSSARTPTLETLEPYTGLPDTLITVTGKTITDIIGTNVAAASNGLTVKFLRVWLTDNLCSLAKEGTTDDFYHLALDNEETTRGSFTCKPVGGFVGHRNASFIIDGDYGRSLESPTTLRVSHNNQVYMFESYAELKDISPNEGSLVGGTKVTLSGKFFDDTTEPPKVYIGGELCTDPVIEPVTDLQDTMLTCYTPVMPTDPSSSGNRGVQVRVWNHTDVASLELWEISDITEEPVFDLWRDEFYWEQRDHFPSGGIDPDMDRFVTSTIAYLVIPQTNMYSFLLNADDEALLYISTDGNPANKVNVSHSINAWDREDATRTDLMELQEGQLVYVEVVHKEMYGRAMVKVALYMTETSYTAKHSGYVDNEIHQIETSMTVKNEIQEWSFLSMSTQAGVQEQWSFSLEFTDPSNRMFQIAIYGVRTVPIAVDAGADTVEYALASLPFSDNTDSGAAITDRYTAQYDDISKTYTITLPSDEGSISTKGNLEVMRADGSSSFNIVNVRRLTEGVPSGQVLSLWMNGGVSPAIRPADISPSKLSSALMVAASVRCPRHILKISSNPYFQDYEKTTAYEESGERTNEIAPFCGHYSSKNPSYVYSAGTYRNDDEDSVWKSGVTTNKPVFCFAFLGSLENDLYVRYWYDNRVHGNTFLFNETYLLGVNEVHDHTDWRYRCMDLLKLIQSVRSDASSSNTAVVQVVVYNSEADTEASPLYIDTVSFTESVPQPLLAPLVDTEQHSNALNSLVDHERQIPLQWGLDSVAVTIKESTNPPVYVVDMTTVDCMYNFGLPELANAQSVSVSGTSATSSLSAGGATLEVSQTQSASPPISGTWDFAMGTFEATGVSAVIEAHDLRGLVSDLGSGEHNMGDVSVTREGDCAGYTWIVEHVTQGGDHPNMTKTQSNLSPSDAVVDVATIQNGGLYFEPLSGGMLRTAHTEPQVTLEINGIASFCNGTCDFSWTEAMTPTMTATSATKGAAGSSLSITGTGFATANEDNEVTIGGVACEVTASNALSITCTLGEGPAGSYPVVVRVNGKGLVRHEPSEFSFEYEFALSGIDPTSGSIKGGSLVTVTGTGFSENSVVTIDGATCTAQADIEYDTIVCLTSAGTSAGSVSVLVRDGEVEVSGVNFLYTNPTSEITGVDPTTAAVEGGTVSIISGTGFSALVSSRVLIGDMEAEILDQSDTSIEVSLPAMVPGVYDVQVNDAVTGNVDNGGAQMSYFLSVTGVSPERGSFAGGTDITLTGQGFSTDKELNDVRIGETVCEVTDATFSQIICRLGDLATTHEITNYGEHPDHGSGYAWSPATVMIQEGDSVKWTWDYPDSLSGIGSRIQQTNNMSALEPLANGFNSGSKMASGTYTHKFWKSGPVYYSSGAVDESRTIYMFGKIVVEERTDVSQAVTVKIGEVEASYQLGGGSGASGCDQNSLPAGCVDLDTTDSSRFSFSPLSCLTPRVTQISSQETSASIAITITGDGFSTTCDNEVIIEQGRYDAGCIITSATSTKIVCALDENCNALPVGISLSVDVRVANQGFALFEIDGPKSSREIMLLPEVLSIHPMSGSKEGGTLITITGSQFLHDPSAPCGVDGNRKKRSVEDFIMNGGNPAIGTLQFPGCSDLPLIESGQIQCLTMPGTGSQDLVPTIVNQAGSFIAECPSSQCSYSFTDDATPTVSAVTPDPITQANEILTVTGTKLGTDDADIAITLGDTPCTVTVISDTSVSCNVGIPVAGVQPFTLTRTSMGTARSSVKELRVSGSLSSITPTVIGLGGGLDCTIQGFGLKSDDTTVSIGGNDCPVTSTAADSVTCVCPPGAEGSAAVAVYSAGEIVTGLSLEYQGALTPEVSSISPASAASGSDVTVEGVGFGNDVGAVSVMFGEALCAVSVVTDTELTCTLGGHAAGSVMATVTVAEAGSAVEASDGALNFTYTAVVASITPSAGSTGGQQSVVVEGQGFQPVGMAVTICGNLCEQDGEATTTTFPCLTPDNAVASPPLACEVAVTLDNGETATAANLYTYEQSSRVTGVTPSSGGTGGGTSVTIDGQNFGSSESDVTVTIDGSTCAITDFSSTRIICDTESHEGSVKTSVDVRIQDSGIAYKESAEFEYIDKWSSPFTWGGGDLPAAGDLIVIPPGMTVLLDTDTPVLKILLIQGKVIFDGETRTLESEIILITDGGALQVGTEDEPYPEGSVATIQMHGHVRSKEIPIYGIKCLALREGSLDLHGHDVETTWSLLDGSVASGATEISVTDNISGKWKVGDRLAIASTGNHLSQRENEERLITAISGTSTLTLDSPLEFSHLGEDVEYTVNGRTYTVAGRAEVALLTRNIVFRGSDDTAWHDEAEACEEGFDTGEFATQTCFQGRFGDEVGSSQFGSHMIFHAPFLNNGSQEQVLQARISNVELTYVGQAFRLGRYAIHFHLNGHMDGSYVKNCAVHQSFNRFINIHNSHDILVQNNVGYNIMGGAYFLEDGVETGNIFEFNVAIFVRGSSSLQNDDITPAAYWVRNPNNTVRHNRAAGGTHFGFWYSMEEHPGAASYDANICPRHVPLDTFTDNVVHSQGWFGIWMFMVYTPMEGGCCDCTVPQAAKFYGLTAWNNEKGAEWVAGGAMQFHDFVLVNNEITGMEAKLIQAEGVTPFHSEEGAMMAGSFIKGRESRLGEVDKPLDPYYAVIVPQGPGLMIKDMIFMDFNDDLGTVLKVTDVQGTTAKFNGGFIYHLTNSTLVNTDKIAHLKWANDAVFVDLDGSLTGMPNGKILPVSGSLPPDHCSTSAKYSRGAVEGTLCDATIDFVRFGFNHYLPDNLEGKNVSFSNEYGETLAFFHEKGLTHKLGWHVDLMVNTEYVMEFVDAGHITNLSYEGIVYDLGVDQHLLITHKFTQNPDVVTITDEIFDPVTELSATNHVHGAWQMVPGVTTYDTTFLVDGEHSETDVNVTVESRKNHTDRSVHLQVYLCKYAGCVEPVPPNEAPPPLVRDSDFVYWSNTTIWNLDGMTASANKSTGSEAGLLPTDEHRVITIEEDSWVVIDQSPGYDFAEINVIGVLEIEFEKQPTDQIVLACTHLLITGRMYVGWPDKPMQNNVIIELLGNIYTPDKPIQNGPNMGAKAIGVFGALEMHGTAVPGWTRLAESISAGDTILVLADDVEAFGWKVGDEVAVAPTGFDPTQYELRTVAAVVGNTVELTEGLEFSHLGETLELANGQMVPMAAEVGLTTRNVRIQGVDHGTMFEDGFGGRVIIGEFSQENDDGTSTPRNGYARLVGVEFRHMGQEGFSDFYDPRYSLAYLNSGASSSDVKPNLVQGCSFAESFNTAIGVSGTTGIVIDGNVIAETVGSSIRLQDEDQRLSGNMVTGTTFAGTFAGRREPKIPYNAGIEINSVTNLTMADNAVSGYVRMGYHIDGEVCGTTSRWTNNHAHSGLVGVGMHPRMGDGTSPCSLVSGFTVWRNWDWGMYLQLPYSVHVENSVLIENTVGTHGIIYQPPSVNHEFEDKEMVVNRTTYVGASPWVDCSDGISIDNPRQEPVLTFSGKGRSWWINNCGKTGASFPSFTSGHNECPKMPCNGVMSYPAINGKHTIVDSHFEGFGQACGCRDYAIATTNKNDDAIHPTYMSGSSSANVDMESLIFIHRAQLGLINPSDCVDMECDGQKKVILTDVDGTYLDAPGSTVISESEWAWGGDPRRGLGDFRLPTVLQTDIDGNRLDISTVLGDRGIVRDESCTLVPSWQAYKCQGLNHQLFMVESMDADTETRRVSPVAVQGPLTGDSPGVECMGTADQPCYVDLVNGPQDHGWCMGYTCQKRLSIFPVVISVGKRYNTVFTGTTPQNIRLHAINAADDERTVMCIYYDRPWHLEVFNGDGEFVAPTNGEVNENTGELELIRPESDVEYWPNPDVHTLPGTNYFDREQQFLCVLLAGSKPINIKTIPLVLVSFDMPPMTVDEFFGEQIIDNLAAYYGIPPEKIKVATAVRSTDGSRKRREEEVIEVSITISNPVRDYSEVDPSDLTLEELEDISSRIINTYQLGEMGDVLGVEILSFSIVEPPADTASDTWQVFAELELSPTLAAEIPSTLSLVQEPLPIHEGAAFQVQPLLQMWDDEENVIDQMGSMVSPWEVTVYLVQVATEWGQQAEVLGSQTVAHSNGYFTFSDLAISHSGEYQLEFVVTSPAEASHFSVTSASFSVADRELAVGVVSQPESLTESEEFDVVVEVIDAVTREKVEDIAWKGHSWGCEISLYLPDIYPGSLSAPVTTTVVDLETGTANFTDLSFTKYGRYFLFFSFLSTPSDMDFMSATNVSVDVYPQGYMVPTKEVLHHVILRFDADYGTVVNDQYIYFAAALYNQLWGAYMDVHFSNFEITEGSIMAEFDISGSKSTLDTMLDSLWMDVKEGYTLSFNGHTVTTTPDMWVDGENWAEDKKEMHTGLIVVIVLLSVALVGVIVGFVIYKYCKSRAGAEDFRTEKRLPTQSRRGQLTSHYQDDSYTKINRPGSGSSTSTGSEDMYAHDDAPILKQQVPPKTTHFDFNRLRPPTSYVAPGTLPALGLEDSDATNVNSRPVSMTHLEFQLANQTGRDLPGVNSPTFE